jgi:hypothetical protein
VLEECADVHKLSRDEELDALAAQINALHRQIETDLAKCGFSIEEFFERFEAIFGPFDKEDAE